VFRAVKLWIVKLI